jgi:hypothetical protein
VRRFSGCAWILLVYVPNPAGAQDVDPASLSRLNDIAMPPPVPWWPPAPGWYWLGGVLLLCLALIAAAALRRYFANRYRRVALREAAQIASATWPPSAASALLKRTAMVAWGRGKIASLNGQAWVDWMNDRCEPPVFTGDSANLLAEGQYDQQQTLNDSQLRELLGAVRHWIRHHQARPG